MGYIQNPKFFADLKTDVPNLKSLKNPENYNFSTRTCASTNFETSRKSAGFSATSTLLEFHKISMILK